MPKGFVIDINFLEVHSRVSYSETSKVLRIITENRDSPEVRSVVHHALHHGSDELPSTVDWVEPCGNTSSD